MTAEHDALDAWGWPGATLSPAESGLINATWIVRVDDAPFAVLQRLNTDIFKPIVHQDIAAVTAHLQRRGVATPALVPTTGGDLWLEDGSGCWRCLSFLGDRTVHKLTDPDDAREAAGLVARWHAALADLRWEFRMVRPGAHDTDGHMERLAAAIRAHGDHRLFDEVAEVAMEVGRRWDAWDGVHGLPRRVIHGDLKISNVRFLGAEAIALIDLDTMARGTIDIELGDAMRSWCNTASEDTRHATFDLALFEAAMRGYAAHGTLTADEWASIVPATERIALELAARFARDALEECYFGWDPRFGGRGEHNLLRAVGQLDLARRIADARDEALRIVRSVA